MSDIEKVRQSHLYCPGSSEQNGVGEAWMSESYDNILVKGAEIIGTTFGGEPRRLAYLDTRNNNWYLADGQGMPITQGHPVIYIEPTDS